MNREHEAQRIAAQQAVIAQLGLAALSGVALDRLMEMAVQQVALTLDVPNAKILKLLPEGEALLLVAGVGWKEGLVGSARVGAGVESQAGFTLHSHEPVTVQDLETERRFSAPALLTEHGVVSGISVIIHGREGPFGVFGAHSRSRRAYSTEDAHFLQAVANVVGTAIERQQAEEALRTSKERLAVAIEASGAGVYEHSVPLGPDHYHSSRWAEILGYQLQDLPSGAAFLNWLLPRVHPDDVERQAGAFDDFVMGRTRSYEVEVRLRHRTGRWLWVRSFAQALEHDELGRVRRLAGMMFDISEQKKAHEEREQLLEALKALAGNLEERVVQRTRELQRRTEQVRVMASSLALAEQRERERISRILHDDLQQLLYAAQLQATMLRSELMETGYGRPPELLNELEQLHAAAVAVTRSLTVELSPPVLEGEGLVQALEWLNNHMANTYGLEVTLTVYDEVEPESTDLRELAFQMVRELLFNVVKHAGVAQAQLTLQAKEGCCVIEVSDEGRGFDEAALDGTTSGRAGYGLRTMRERLALFDGTLEMSTAPGSGTRVTIVMPGR